MKNYGKDVRNGYNGRNGSSPGIAAAGTKEPDAGRKNFPFFCSKGTVGGAGMWFFLLVLGMKWHSLRNFPKKWEKVVNASTQFIVQKSNFPRLL